jgi:membrane fusion protein (multidrug efflux system)
VTYNGKVLELGVGTGSAFSLLPAQNATGNWIKIVQRVPVRVVFTEPTQIGVHPLRVGMSLNVKVNLHDESGPMLAQESPSQAAFSTDVYQQQLNESDALIAQIIHTNMAGSVK